MLVLHPFRCSRHRGRPGRVAYNFEVNLRALREETEQQHSSLEALLPLSDPGLELPLYRQILECFYTIVRDWEGWAVLHAPPRFAALVQERRRSPLLLSDLQTLGVPLPESGPQPPLSDLLRTRLADTASGSPEYEATFLGAMYVMEGSTLGGQYIARHVEEVLGLAAGQGDAYFRGYGERTGAMWNAFREVLSGVPDQYGAIVIEAARTTFHHLETVFRDCLRTPAAASGANADRHACA